MNCNSLLHFWILNTKHSIYIKCKTNTELLKHIYHDLSDQNVPSRSNKNAENQQHILSNTKCQEDYLKLIYAFSSIKNKLLHDVQTLS